MIIRYLDAWGYYIFFFVDPKLIIKALVPNPERKP